MRSTLLLVTCCCLATVASLGDEPQSQSANAPGLFNDYVQPLLKTHCYECHSHDSGEAEGGLMLDSRRGWQTGGSLGPSIVPGKPDMSWLYKALTYEHDELQMPPDEKLSDADIKHVRRWIELGAPDPRQATTAIANHADNAPQAANLWSIKPLQGTEPIAVQGDEWSRGRIDRYLLARMKNAGLHPSDDAPPHTLLARLHYVLTGLIPKPEETDAFVAAFLKDADGAIAKKVDELLKRPDFGIRWGRHWLDVARYADAPGTTRPTPYAQSWRYRNYVIDALRRDTPFDVFVRQQIAGDLLPAKDDVERTENLIATGFISLGHVLGADRDVEKLTLDRIDEQLDVIGTTFLGIRIGCARCHDHRLDPVPTRDYYAMAGIFRSTAAGPARRMAAGLRPAGELPVNKDGPDWARANDKTRYHGAAEADTIRDEPIHLRGDTNLTGEFIPRGFPTLVSLAAPNIPEGASGRLQLTEWLLDESNPLVPRVIVNRVWHHVFGAGIVRTTDNFGLTGELPSHPQLLDDLAIRFRTEHAYRLKSLIREMLISRAFRQRSGIAFQPAKKNSDDGGLEPCPTEIDPENRLLWRANLRRMDAEPLVDSIRDVVGKLDHSSAGRTVPNFRVSNQGSTLDLEIGREVLGKRAIYWPVFRKDVPVVMDALPIFNFPPATASRGRRDETHVPSQSLSLLNSQITLDAARRLSKQLQTVEGDDTARIRFVYRKLFGRSPSDRETASAISFLQEFRKEVRGANAAKPQNVGSVSWNRLCHSLLICNEFLVIE